MNNTLAWLKTAKNQKYSHMITIISDGIEMAMFFKSVEERKQKVIEIEEFGMIMGKFKAHVSGVFAIN